jgi:hypothetical protein
MLAREDEDGETLRGIFFHPRGQLGSAVGAYAATTSLSRAWAVNRSGQSKTERMAWPRNPLRRRLPWTLPR